MKPRNKMERRVVELAATLPGLTGQQECQMLKFADPNGSDYNARYVTLVQRCEEFQVFRVFMVCIYHGNTKYPWKMCLAKTPHKYVQVEGECYQIWLNENGKVIINGISLTFMPNYKRPRYQWKFYEEMSIKQDRDDGYYRTAKFYDTTDYVVEDSWHPTLLRNLGGEVPINEDMRYICECVLSDPFMETLYKSKDKIWFAALLKHKNELNVLIPAIKVAMRHKYKPNSISTYFDHIRLLHRLGKDIRNPHYVCPADLDEEHRRYYAMWERQEQARKAREERERAIRRLEEEKGRAESYAKRINPFLQLVWHADNYAVFVCPSVMDMEWYIYAYLFIKAERLS